MPRIDHRAEIATTLTPDARLVLEVLLDEINALRTQASLPPRTADEIRLAVRDAVRARARVQQGGA